MNTIPKLNLNIHNIKEFSNPLYYNQRSLFNPYIDDKRKHNNNNNPYSNDNRKQTPKYVYNKINHENNPQYLDDKINLVSKSLENKRPQKIEYRIPCFSEETYKNININIVPKLLGTIILNNPYNPQPSTEETFYCYDIGTNYFQILSPVKIPENYEVNPEFIYKWSVGYLKVRKQNFEYEYYTQRREIKQRNILIHWYKTAVLQKQFRLSILTNWRDKTKSILTKKQQIIEHWLSLQTHNQNIRKKFWPILKNIIEKRQHLKTTVIDKWLSVTKRNISIKRKFFPIIKTQIEKLKFHRQESIKENIIEHWNLVRIRNQNIRNEFIPKFKNIIQIRKDIKEKYKLKLQQYVISIWKVTTETTQERAKNMILEFMLRRNNTLLQKHRAMRQILTRIKTKHNIKLYKSIRRRINTIIHNCFNKWKLFIQNRKQHRIQERTEYILNSNKHTIIRSGLSRWITQYRKQKERDTHLSRNVLYKLRYKIMKRKLNPNLIYMAQLEKLLITFSFLLISDCLNYIEKFISDEKFIKDADKYIGSVELVLNHKTKKLSPNILLLLINKCSRHITDSRFPIDLICMLENKKNKISNYTSFVHMMTHLSCGMFRFTQILNIFSDLSKYHPAPSIYMDYIFDKIYRREYDIDGEIVIGWAVENEVPKCAYRMLYTRDAKNIVNAWLTNSQKNSINIIKMLNDFSED